jgi:hypothetical protein
MGRKLESLGGVRICWGVINLLEGEDCFHYHHLLHLADGDALAVWRRRLARKEEACSRDALFTIVARCSLHIHSYQVYLICTYLRANCPSRGSCVTERTTMRPASRPITITTCLSTFFSARHSNNPHFTIYTIIHHNDNH